MTLSGQELRPVDLRDVPPEQLAALGESALAHCVALYRQRLEAGGALSGAGSDSSACSRRIFLPKRYGMLTMAMTCCW